MGMYDLGSGLMRYFAKNVEKTGDALSASLLDVIESFMEAEESMGDSDRYNGEYLLLEEYFFNYCKGIPSENITKALLNLEKRGIITINKSNDALAVKIEES